MENIQYTYAGRQLSAAASLTLDILLFTCTHVAGRIYIFIYLRECLRDRVQYVLSALLIYATFEIKNECCAHLGVYDESRARRTPNLTRYATASKEQTHKN